MGSAPLLRLVLALWGVGLTSIRRRPQLTCPLTICRMGQISTLPSHMLSLIGIPTTAPTGPSRCTRLTTTPRYFQMPALSRTVSLGMPCRHWQVNIPMIFSHFLGRSRDAMWVVLTPPNCRESNWATTSQRSSSSTIRLSQGQSQKILELPSMS